MLATQEKSYGALVFMADRTQTGGGSLDVEGIIERYKQEHELSKDVELARMLDLSSGTIPNWKRRGTLDLTLLAERARPGADWSYIMSGRRSEPDAGMSGVDDAGAEILGSFTREDVLRAMKLYQHVKEWSPEDAEAERKRTDEGRKKKST